MWAPEEIRNKNFVENTLQKQKKKIMTWYKNIYFSCVWTLSVDTKSAFRQFFFRKKKKDEEKIFYGENYKKFIFVMQN